MRLILLLACVAFATTMSAAGQTGGKKDGAVCALKVSGMACSKCSSTVEKAATKLDGVTAASVSQPKGVADITYDPAKTSPEAIAKALQKKTGFKVEVPR